VLVEHGINSFLPGSRKSPGKPGIGSRHVHQHASARDKRSRCLEGPGRLCREPVRNELIHCSAKHAPNLAAQMPALLSRADLDAFTESGGSDAGADAARDGLSA